MDKGNKKGLTVGQNKSNKWGIIRGVIEEIIRGEFGKECKIIIDTQYKGYYIDIDKGIDYNIERDGRVLDKLLEILPGLEIDYSDFVYLLESPRTNERTLRYALYFKY